MSAPWLFALRGDDSEALELDIYDDIGFYSDTDASSVRRRLKDSTANLIKVRINSGGGDVYDGIAIYNLLKSHAAKVEVCVDGWAASAASIIAMAGDEIRIAENAMMMIHEAWGRFVGGIKELESKLSALTKVNEGMARTYASASERRGKNISAADFAALMKKETWFSADEAIEHGLADHATAAQQLSASWNPTLSRANNIPKALAVSVLAGLRGSSQINNEDLTRLRKAAGEPENKPRSQDTLTSEEKRKVETMKLVAFAAALGMSAEASEEDVLKHVTSTSRFKSQVESQTGKTGEEALGTVAAWKESHGKVEKVEAELTDIKAESEKAQLKSLIEGGRSGSGFEDKKPRLTKAMADKLESQVNAKEMSLQAAKAFVEVLPPVAHLSANPTAQSPSSKGSVEGSEGVSWNGKAYRNMNSRERMKLFNEDKDLFGEMRSDWESQGMPCAD